MGSRESRPSATDVRRPSQSVGGSKRWHDVYSFALSWTVPPWAKYQAFRCVMSSFITKKHDIIDLNARSAMHAIHYQFKHSSRIPRTHYHGTVRPRYPNA